MQEATYSWIKKRWIFRFVFPERDVGFQSLRAYEVQSVDLQKVDLKTENNFNVFLHGSTIKTDALVEMSALVRLFTFFK